MKAKKIYITTMVIIVLELIIIASIAIYVTGKKRNVATVKKSDITITDEMIFSKDGKTGYLHGLWGDGESKYSFGLCCGVNLQTLKGADSVEKIVLGKFAVITQWERQIEGDFLERETDNYFWAFPNLKEIEVELGNTHMAVKDGILYHLNEHTGNICEIEACVPTLSGEIIITEGVEIVNGMNHCKGITTVKLPSTVTAIYPGSLDNLENCQEFLVDKKNQTYCSVDGAIYTKDKKDLIVRPLGKSGKRTR